MTKADKKYLWDLESLLEKGTVEQLFDKWEKQEEKLISLFPTFIDSLSNFKQWLVESEKTEILSNKIYNYVSNSLNEDLSNPTILGWMQRLQNKSNEYSVAVSNYNNVVIKNKTKILEYLKDPEIQEYKIGFDRIFESSKHMLDAKSELLLAKLSIYTPGIEDTYSTLIDNDLKYEDAINSKGKKVKLATQADIFRNLKSTDPVLRKSTWLSFHKAFYGIRATLTKTLYYNYLQLNTLAKVRGFDNYVAQTAFADEIKVDFILKLYEKIKLFKPLIKRYQKAKAPVLKQLFNLSKINPWDGYLELSKIQKKYTIEEAQQMVLDAVKILGTEYTKTVKRAFTERWISWLPSPTKHTGAYSIGGTKGLDKFFISMNFDETLRAVYTLAHELGHSLNSYYCNKEQDIYVGTSIFYAEVSSITNEMFMNFYLLDKNQDNPKAKLSILDEMISNFIATTTRQVIFSEFEYKSNEIINKSEPFSYEVVEKLYKDISAEYVESSVDYEKDPYFYSLITPLRIPHFYVGNFYVYKYAIGQIAAVLIAHRIKSNPENKAKLFSFLSSGNKLSPLETIKLLGINLEEDEAWTEAYNIFESWVSEFEKCAKKQKNK